VLNRKYADLRHYPRLDPRLLRYDPRTLPQAVVRLGPRCARKAKAGTVLGEPGFTWALFFFPGRWYTITSVYDARVHLVGHHVDLCLPPEERDGVLSFLDLKLDLLLLASGEGRWLDQDEYDQEVRAQTIPPSWQDAVRETVAALDRDRRSGGFPPVAVSGFQPAADTPGETTG